MPKVPKVAIAGPFALPSVPFDIIPDNLGSMWCGTPSNLVQVNSSDGTTANFAWPLVIQIGPSFMAFDGTNVWTLIGETNPAQDFLAFVALNGNSVTTYKIAARGVSIPNYIVYDGSTFMYILSSGAAGFGILYKVTAATGVVVSSYTLAGQADYGNGRTLIYDGANCWCTDGAGTLYKIVGATMLLAASFPVGTYPGPGSVVTGGVFDGTNIWYNDNNSVIWKINPATGASHLSLYACDEP